MVVRQQTQVGLLADIHYDGGAVAMNRLYESIVALNAGSVDALVLMGDLVNGTSALHAKRLLREVSALCDAFKGRIYVMPGNHDLDYISKSEFYRTLDRDGDTSRFHFKLNDHTCICIDGNFSPDGTEYNCGNFRWQDAYVPQEELDWLRGRLMASLLPVVVFSHQRIDQECTHAVINHEEVRAVLQLSEKVLAVFQGHNHVDDLKQIENISYYTLAAHADGAGPAVIHFESNGVRLMRDFLALETA